MALRAARHRRGSVLADRRGRTDRRRGDRGDLGGEPAAGQFVGRRTPQSRCRLIELLDKIHSALQRFTDGTFGPMFRTQIKKIAAVRAGECYKVLYQTAYTLPGVQEGQSAKLPPSSIRLEMK